MNAVGVAYSTAKLAILYYAHELQRHAGPDFGVSVFEPGWMPGTALGRGAPPALQAIGRGLARLPGIATPARSGPALASIALDQKWANLRDGAFVVVDKVRGCDPSPMTVTGNAACGRPRPSSSTARRAQLIVAVPAIARAAY